MTTAQMSSFSSTSRETDRISSRRMASSAFSLSGRLRVTTATRSRWSSSRWAYVIGVSRLGPGRHISLQELHDGGRQRRVADGGEMVAFDDAGLPIGQGGGQL